ncbi:MAG: 50S ribosomal protein L3 [Candidatus Korarchaeum sp.]|nr:50S ribosomal protein L3 [Candidatus Korarchaeum sp.]MDW8034901.1 50S ribosomal protein L3 [Candidatus Korarchaeum sp.]
MPRRHGSLQYYPRKRAATQKAVFRSYPELSLDKPTLVAFPGYKAGMLHVLMKEDRPGKLNLGQQIVLASTVIETPPIEVVGFRAYKEDHYGLKPLVTAVRIENNDLISRTLTVGKGVDNLETAIPKLESSKNQISEIRVLTYTRPDLAGIHKKKPEFLEIPVKGGEVDDRVSLAVSLVGSQVKASNVFKVGQLVDLTAITKGHGWQGVVRRFGIELLRHKAGKGRWRVGSLGSRHPPYVTWRVPRAGQTGYHKRTEYNKRILMLEDLTDGGIDLTPKGGFRSYGVLKSQYILVSGSVPGPAKRFVFIRHPIRPKYEKLPVPEIYYVSSVGWLKR